MAEAKTIKVIVNDCVLGYWYPTADPKIGYGRGETVEVAADSDRVKHALAIGLVRVAEPAKAGKE